MNGIQHTMTLQIHDYKKCERTIIKELTSLAFKYSNNDIYRQSKEERRDQRKKG